jgi:hypothetical protein
MADCFTLSTLPIPPEPKPPRSNDCYRKRTCRFLGDYEQRLDFYPREVDLASFHPRKRAWRFTEVKWKKEYLRPGQLQSIGLLHKLLKADVEIVRVCPERSKSPSVRMHETTFTLATPFRIHQPDSASKHGGSASNYQRSCYGSNATTHERFLSVKSAAATSRLAQQSLSHSIRVLCFREG